jgi:dephospho-CoA kinase
MAIKIGITGGMGSGKSVVSHLMELMNIPVYDSDREAKRLTMVHPSIRSSLTALLGQSLYASGTLNKQMLAGYIFRDATHLEAVNHIIHPCVKDDFLEWASHSSSPIVGFESAILFDVGFKDAMDVVINVSAPVELRIERACARDKSSRSLIVDRIERQMSDEERNRLSDYTIVNDDSTPVIAQLLNVIDDVKKRFLH